MNLLPGSRGLSFALSTQWHLPAEVEAVWGAVAAVPAYPAWWPQVRRAVELDERTVELTCRSLLPADLTFATRRAYADRARGVLRADLSGGLVGWSQWTLAPADGGGCRVLFDEQVEVGGPLLRAARGVGRAMLRANWDAMMRGGEQGLRAYLT